MVVWCALCLENTNIFLCSFFCKITPVLCFGNKFPHCWHYVYNDFLFTEWLGLIVSKPKTYSLIWVSWSSWLGACNADSLSFPITAVPSQNFLFQMSEWEINLFFVMTMCLISLCLYALFISNEVGKLMKNILSTVTCENGDQHAKIHKIVCNV